jgi:protein phosphatase
MDIKIPQLSLVLLIGPSGSGKTTFASRHFSAFEVLSSDYCRGLVSDDENNQRASKDAFDVLYLIARKRLKAGKLTVIDATNVRRDDRKPLLAMARKYHYAAVAIVFDLPVKTCLEHNQERGTRILGPHIIERQRGQMEQSLVRLQGEGFRGIYTLESEAGVDAARVKRLRLRCDKTHLGGPFDMIGDIHGCCDELEELLDKLGYRPTGQNVETPMTGPVYTHPNGRTAVFLGDIVDRGPRIIDTIKLVCNMVQTGGAFCVPGNHDIKLTWKLRGKNIGLKHGLARTMAEIDALPPGEREEFIKQTAAFIEGLPVHYLFDDGRLAVAHAGIKRGMHGRVSEEIRQFCLYGETRGEIDEFGLPIRYDWAAGYGGRAFVVYGHTPVPAAEWVNKTANIDTGCVFGGKLTALRYPEREFVSVPARKTYVQSLRPMDFSR